MPLNSPSPITLSQQPLPKLSQTRDGDKLSPMSSTPLLKTEPSHWFHLRQIKTWSAVVGFLQSNTILTVLFAGTRHTWSQEATHSYRESITQKLSDNNTVGVRYCCELLLAYQTTRRK